MYDIGMMWAPKPKRNHRNKNETHTKKNTNTLNYNRSNVKSPSQFHHIYERALLKGRRKISAKYRDSISKYSNFKSKIVFASNDTKPDWSLIYCIIFFFTIRIYGRCFLFKNLFAYEYFTVKLYCISLSV